MTIGMKKKSKLTVPDPVFFELFPVKPGKGDLRKEAIIKAAIECIAKEGPLSTNFENIGKRLGIRRSHVAYHFSSLNDLFTACIQYITAIAQRITVEAVQTAKTPQEKVLAVFEGGNAWLEKYPDHGAVMLFLYSLCSHDDHFLDLNTQVRRAGLERLEAILTPLYEDRTNGKALAKSTAFAAQTLIIGAWIFRLTTHDSRQSEQMHRELRETIRSLLDKK